MKLVKCILATTLCCLMTQNLFAQAGIAGSADNRPQSAQDPQAACEQDLLSSYVSTHIPGEDETHDDDDDIACDVPKPGTKIRFSSTDCGGKPGLRFPTNRIRATERTIIEGTIACAELKGLWRSYCAVCNKKGLVYNPKDPLIFERVNRCADDPNMIVECGTFSCKGEPKPVDEIAENPITEAHAIASSVCSNEPLVNSAYDSAISVP